MKWISPEECRSIMSANSMELLDIRENWEYQICHIGSTHIPMHLITDKAVLLDKEKPYLIVCKTGRRAEAVANLLESEHGFKNIAVLKGGITAWYALTDPSFEMY